MYKGRERRNLQQINDMRVLIDGYSYCGRITYTYTVRNTVYFRVP